MSKVWNKDDFTLENQEDIMIYYLENFENFNSWLNFLSDRKSIKEFKRFDKYIIQKYKESGLSIGWLDRCVNNRPINGPTRIGTIFITCLDEDVLRHMFGQPIEHSEFGEGFADTEELDDDGEYIIDAREYTSLSYFIKVIDIQLHISYDHRGTKWEFSGANNFSDITQCFKILFDYYLITCKEENSSLNN